MSELEERIRYLSETTALTNPQIARKLDCSRRTVRRVAGPYAKRITGKLSPAYKAVISADPEYKTAPAKILLFDIETSPMEVYTWQLYKQVILPTMVIKDWAVLSWSAKWLFNKDVISAVVTPYEAKAREDSSIIGGIWELLNEADIVIAHNGDKFDLKKLNSRFAINGLTPPMPYRSIDTLKASKRVFSMSAFSLDYLNALFDLEGKIKTTFELWSGCVGGDAQALKIMEKYNRRDVLALEELYITIRPWIKSHPNLGLFIDTDKTICTNCGNEELEWSGKYFTPAGKYKAFRCLSCGAIGRSRYSELTAEDKESLCLSVAT